MDHAELFVAGTPHESRNITSCVLAHYLGAAKTVARIDNIEELTNEEKARYNAVYCGICRSIREQASSAARLGLSYDMAFLALLLMSLYEPSEETGNRACRFHPIRQKSSRISVLREE